MGIEPLEIPAQELILAKKWENSMSKSFRQPISMAGDWGREVFAFAIALQNLIRGASQPFAGIIADKMGAGKASSQAPSSIRWVC